MNQNQLQIFYNYYNLPIHSSNYTLSKELYLKKIKRLLIEKVPTFSDEYEFEKWGNKPKTLKDIRPYL